VGVQAKQEELIAMAGDMQAATEEVSQLRKQLSALGAQLDAASSQISQQQAAVAALEDTKSKLQVRQGSWGHRACVLVRAQLVYRRRISSHSVMGMLSAVVLLLGWLLSERAKMAAAAWVPCCRGVTVCANNLSNIAEWWRLARVLQLTVSCHCAAVADLLASADIHLRGAEAVH
jgi:hypothetical protein